MSERNIINIVNHLWKIFYTCLRNRFECCIIVLRFYGINIFTVPLICYSEFIVLAYVQKSRVKHWYRVHKLISRYFFFFSSYRESIVKPGEWSIARRSRKYRVADIITVLDHSGFEMMDKMIASEVEEVDGVVSGHDNTIFVRR